MNIVRTQSAFPASLAGNAEYQFKRSVELLSRYAVGPWCRSFAAHDSSGDGAGKTNTGAVT